MAAELIVAPEAEQDVADAYAWYESRLHAQKALLWLLLSKDMTKKRMVNRRDG